MPEEEIKKLIKLQLHILLTMGVFNGAFALKTYAIISQQIKDLKAKNG